MIATRALALAAGLLLAACGTREPPPGFAGAPSPALYEIASPDGAVEGWLFGTIHSLPDGVGWESKAVDGALEQADLLVVEARDLDAATLRDAYETRAHTPGQPPLAERVPPALRPELRRILADGSVPDERFADLETWAAALVVADLVQDGERANGVDRQLLARFPSDRTSELEGTGTQLDIFDRLPGREQRDLLAAILLDHQRDRDDALRSARQWYRGDIAGFADPARSALMADPELRKALYSDRNRAWVDTIEAELRRAPRPFIAVGAAHLAGDEGLPGLLAKRGYTVRRIR